MSPRKESVEFANMTIETSRIEKKNKDWKRRIEYLGIVRLLQKT
jgi:hypothetical protein